MKALRSSTARAVATVITQAREEAGLTQRELAKRLKWPHSVIGMIETDQRQVKMPEFVAIAVAVGTDPVDLMKRVIASGAGVGVFGVITGKPSGKKRPPFL